MGDKGRGATGAFGTTPTGNTQKRGTHIHVTGFRGGATQRWYGIQARDHRDPVTTSEVRTGTTIAIPLTMPFTMPFTPDADRPARARFTKR